MNSTIKTVFHAYSFNTAIVAERAAWIALKAKLTAQGIHEMHSWGGSSHYLPQFDGRTIELETRYLFDNQWNTAPIEDISEADYRAAKPGQSLKGAGYRVFDWARDAGLENKDIRRGHWLEQTTEMRAIRDNTNVCGYCGKQEPAAKGDVFCPHCVDSEYLTADTLHLTRMRPVSVRGDRAPLSVAESAHLLPRWREAQIHGQTERGKIRIAKRLEEVEAKCRKAIANAEAERGGFVWLMGKGINTNNVIFYTHTGRFGFGWRNPVDAELLSTLLDVISEFPYPYDINCADGRTLSGG